MPGFPRLSPPCVTSGTLSLYFHEGNSDEFIAALRYFATAAEQETFPEAQLYSRERKLIEEIKIEVAEGRRCQVFAIYTRKHDVTARLERILTNEGIRTAVLRASVDTSKREAWYARQIKDGVRVVISHPKLVETGLDLLDFPIGRRLVLVAAKKIAIFRRQLF